MSVDAGLELAKPVVALVLACIAATQGGFLVWLLASKRDCWSQARLVIDVKGH